MINLCPLWFYFLFVFVLYIGIICLVTLACQISFYQKKKTTIFINIIIIEVFAQCKYRPVYDLENVRKFDFDHSKGQLIQVFGINIRTESVK